MKYSKLFYCIAIVCMFFFFMSILTGCGPKEVVPRGPSGAPAVDSWLIAETQGCRIYQVDTDHLSASHLYLSKCDFDNTSSLNEKHPNGKSDYKSTNVTVPAPVVDEETKRKQALEKEVALAKGAMSKLTPEEQRVLGLK